MTGISHMEETDTYHITPFIGLNFDPKLLTPGVVHIGFGNFSRAFVLDIFTDMTRKGYKDWGVIAIAPSNRQEVLVRGLKRQNFIYTLVMRNGYEEIKKVGSLKDVLIAQNNPENVIRVIVSPETKLVTTTVTQAGYCVDLRGNPVLPKNLKEDVQAIKQNKLENLQTMPGWITASIYLRFKQKEPPPILISCDNFPGNGDLFRKVIKTVAKELGDAAFVDYVKNDVLFPNTVVDRVTPHQNYDENSRHILSKYGITDNSPIECEPYRRWFIEDIFPSKSKPPFDEVEDVRFVPSIRPYENRKLLLLNGSHLAIGIVSKMLQVSTVRQATQDPDIRSFWLNFLHQAAFALKNTSDVPISSFFKDTIVRLENPSITDNIDRLLSSTSSKITSRLLNKAAVERGLPFDASAFAIASWLHYMQGRDVYGNPYNLHERDHGKLQRLGIIDPSESKEKLMFFLAGQEITRSSTCWGNFIERIIEDYKLILHTGLRETMRNRFPANLAAKLHI